MTHDLPQTNYTHLPVRMSFPDGFFDHELTPNPELYHHVPRITVLFTTTSYPCEKGSIKMSPESALRAKLAMQMMYDARSLGYDVVCVDAKSESGWRQAVKDLGVVLLDEDIKDLPGAHFMGKSRRQAAAAAGNLGKHEMMAWLEPEKHPYVLRTGTFLTTDPTSCDSLSLPLQMSCLAMTLTPLLEGKADAIVPRRLDNLASYPAQAQMEEIMANITYKEDLEKFYCTHPWYKDEPDAQYLNRPTYLDLQFGPKSFKKDVLEYMLNYPGKILTPVEKGEDPQGLVNAAGKDGVVAAHKWRNHDQWESTFMPFWWMMLSGKTVRGVAVPYEHPPEQTAFEAGKPSYNKKRIDQAVVLTSALQRLLDNVEANQEWTSGGKKRTVIPTAGQ